jgi:UPF0755 protein
MSSTNKRQAFRSGLGVFLGALVVLVAAAFIAAAAVLRAPASLPREGILVTVESGESAAKVSSNLESSGAIRSGLVFRALIRLEKVGDRLKAGTYRIEPGMGSLAVLNLLVSGRQALMRVTLPEGYSLSETARLLEEEGIAPASDFQAAARDSVFVTSLGLAAPSLEGYLFPDTYFFPKGYGAQAAARAMVREFREKLAATIPESGSLSARELEERVILASIVEREYRRSEEAPLIASVFYNRLRIGMALQSCATVVYVITEKQGKPHPDVIYDRDLEIKDAYNTYRQRGLPPGPICSPGLTALEAAFRPASSKYLYFRLVDPEAGRHHFSETLEEHNQAAALIVKRVGGK